MMRNGLILVFVNLYAFIVIYSNTFLFLEAIFKILRAVLINVRFNLL